MHYVVYFYDVSFNAVVSFDVVVSFDADGAVREICFMSFTRGWCLIFVQVGE